MSFAIRGLAAAGAVGALIATRALLDGHDAEPASEPRLDLHRTTHLDPQGPATPPPDAPTPPPVDAPTPPADDIRIVLDRHLARLLRNPNTRAASERLFNTPSTYVASDRGRLNVPRAWSAHPTLLFDSYADFAAAARKGLPNEVEAVVYDNETWSRTPAREQADPDHYAGKFARLAHRLGLTFIAAPAPTTGSLFTGDARHADIMVVQAQGAEANPPGYAAVVNQARRAARALNPDVRIVAEISTNPDKLTPDSDGAASPTELRRTADNLVGDDAPAMDGVWPWIYQTHAGRANGIGIVKYLGASELGDGARRAAAQAPNG